MKKTPIVIELCGIPYSRKTTTITKMTKHLRSHGIKYRVIDEFRGDGDFYESAKYTPDLNMVRALRCLEGVITSIHKGFDDVILIDRGVFDTYCWLTWFEEKKNASQTLKEFSETLISIIKHYAYKYHIVWMDIDPVVSIAQHSHQGSIVNLSTISELRSCYRKAQGEYSENLSISRVESEKANSDVMAERLVQQFKLIKLQ